MEMLHFSARSLNLSSFQDFLQNTSPLTNSLRVVVELRVASYEILLTLAACDSLTMSTPFGVRRYHHRKNTKS